jgi:hypothetical protein
MPDGQIQIPLEILLGLIVALGTMLGIVNQVFRLLFDWAKTLLPKKAADIVASPTEITLQAVAEKQDRNYKQIESVVREIAAIKSNQENFGQDLLGVSDQVKTINKTLNGNGNPAGGLVTKVAVALEQIRMLQGRKAGR